MPEQQGHGEVQTNKQTNKTNRNDEFPQEYIFLMIKEIITENANNFYENANNFLCLHCQRSNANIHSIPLGIPRTPCKIFERSGARI